MWANSSKRVIVVSRSGHDDVKRFWKRQKHWKHVTPATSPRLHYEWMVDHFHVTSTWSTTDTVSNTGLVLWIKVKENWHVIWKWTDEAVTDRSFQTSWMPKKERYVIFIFYHISDAPIKVVHTCDLIMQVNYALVQIKMKRKLRTQCSCSHLLWRMKILF